MTQQEFKKLVEKQQKGNLSRTEQQVLEAFVEKLQKKQKSHELHLTRAHKNRIRRKIDAVIAPAATQKSFPFKELLAYAACFVLLLGIAGLTYQHFSVSYVTEKTGKGERRKLVLADGSTIHLNANSSITYREDFKENRSLQLTGEAFFEVQRDKKHPFTIETGSVRTTVLGTSFNINSYTPEEPVVSVRSGKVKVEHIETQKVVYLVKNEQVVFKGSENPVTTQSINDDRLAWMQNTIALKNTSLLKTAAILENWYDVKIEFEDPAVEKLSITGKFHNEPLETVLKSIALINQLEIDTLTQNHFIIRKNSN